MQWRVKGGIYENLETSLRTDSLVINYSEITRDWPRYSLVINYREIIRDWPRDSLVINHSEITRDWPRDSLVIYYSEITRDWPTDFLRFSPEPWICMMIVSRSQHRILSSMHDDRTTFSSQGS